MDPLRSVPTKIKIENDAFPDELGYGEIHIKDEHPTNFDVEFEDIEPKTETIKEEPSTIINSTVAAKNMEPRRGSSKEHLPSKRRKTTMKPLTSREKNMTLDVLKYVQDSWPKDKYCYKTDVAQTTAAILGIGITSVYRILKENKKYGRVVSPVTTKKRLTVSEKTDNIDKSTIRKMVHNFYLKGEIPTVMKLVDAINEHDKLPHIGESSLRRLLRNIKFKSLKLQRQSALIESTDIVLWRNKYLKMINKYREEGQRIFYLGETLVNKVLFVMHIRSEQKYEDECLWIYETKRERYLEYYPKSNFDKWFEKLLPKLGENAVIVMDNASHHSKKKENAPKMSWNKQNIQKWLISKNIKFEEDCVKAELIEIVRGVKGQYHACVIDEMAKTHNVEVLRLPHNHCELNPVELILADIKGCVENHKSDNSTLIKILNEKITKLPLDKWNNYLDIVKKEEERLSTIDSHIDQIIDSINTNVTGSDTDTASQSSCTETDTDE